MNLEKMNRKETYYLAAMLEKENVKTLRFDDQVIYEPGYLKTGQGKPFSVLLPLKEDGLKILKWIFWISTTNTLLKNLLILKVIYLK